MGILQNILKTINSAIDNIDFSPYQLISGKNTADGYLGLDENSKFDPFYLNRKKIYAVYESFQNKASLITNTNSSSLGGNLGTGYTTGNHQINAVNGNSNIKLWRSGLSVSSVVLTTGAIGYTGDFCKLASPAKERFYSKVYFERNNPNTSQVLEIGLMDQVGAARTGVLFAQDPTINSGNWRVCKSISGVNTYIDTNVAYTDNAITQFELYYDKETEICKFYLNDTLVYTMNDVNLLDTTVLPYWKMKSNSTAQTTLRRLVICDLYWSLELP